MENEKTPLQFWTEYVEQSRGTAYFIPDAYKDEAKQIEKQKKEFNDLLNKTIAEKEVDLQIATQNLFHKIRKHIKANGQEDVFSKDIGWNKDGLEQGFLVINIIQAPTR